MKFIHIADVHLGAAPDKGYRWSQARSEEIWRSFRAVIKRAEEEQADLLLIAGDLFHHTPLARELKEVNYLFGRLSHTQVVMIAGNHDYLKRDANISGFLWAENVTLLDGDPCGCVHFPEWDTYVYGFSYHAKEITKPLYNGLRAQKRPGCHILLAHGGDERHIPIDRQRLLSGGFDYVALGHIHKPQFLAADRMAYAGSLEPLDATEGGEHGYIAGVYANGRACAKFVPFACRKYIQLELKSNRESTDFSMQEQLLQSIKRCGEHNIYKVRICGYRDPQIVYQTGTYRDLGNILEVTDETEPDYDFETLRRVHGNDVVGRYISRFLDGQENAAWEEGEREVWKNNSIRKKALYYGINAMLSGKGE